MAVLPGEKQLTAALPIELVEKFRAAVKEGPDSKLVVKALVRLWLELPESERFGIAYEKGSILARLKKLPDGLVSTREYVVAASEAPPVKKPRIGAPRSAKS